MTPADVAKRVAQIDAAKGDPEIAHGMEDNLYTDVVKFLSIHSTCEHCRDVALEALKTDKIPFDRWTA